MVENLMPRGPWTPHACVPRGLSKFLLVVGWYCPVICAWYERMEDAAGNSHIRAVAT